MATNLQRIKSPEEWEAEAKRGELAALESRLAEQELSLATAQAEMRLFERRYLKALGGRFAELDRT